MEWEHTENAIYREVNFLKNHLLLSPYTQNDPIKCNECLFRQIGILIVSGQVKLNKVNGDINIFWPTKNNSKAISAKMHGSDWHDGLIKKIAAYFENNNLKQVFEPSLHYGRADLGIPSISTYFEIGTINLYKLYINLLKMKDCKIVLIPFENYFIKFIL